MKQLHRIKELNRKLEDALKKIAGLCEGGRTPFTNHIQEIAEEALDKKGNHK